MRRAGWKFARSLNTWVFILAVVAIAGTTSLSAARADEAQAKSLFKAMSDYLAAQKAISFAYDSSLEVVTKKDQKLGLASSGTLTLNRPDKLHATRTGGFANVEMVYDGKTLTMLGKNANAFAKAEEPGTIDQLVDVLRKKYDRPVPAADLLMSDPYSSSCPWWWMRRTLEAASSAASNVTISLSEPTRWIGRFGSPREIAPIPVDMSSPARRLRGRRNTPSMSGTGKQAPRSLLIASA